MERTMSVEERIRKAEEIYNRRRENINEENIARVAVNEKKDFRLFRKLILQIITCLLIYSIFYLIVNNNYIFSQDFKNRAREILSYDINFQNLYQMGIEKFNSIFEEKKTEETQNTQENMETNVENNQENKIETNPENNVENTEVPQDIDEAPNADTTENTSTSQENIGGAAQVEEVSNIQETEEVVLSQEEQDAKYIKETISFIKPVQGTISSKYGYRETASEGIPKNHTGLDIAAVTGTKIASATEGIVILASSEGDYRKSSENSSKRYNSCLCSL